MASTDTGSFAAAIPPVPSYVDPLLNTSRSHWTGNGGVTFSTDRKYTVGQSATVYYTFLKDATSLRGTDADGFAAMSDAQKQAAVWAMAQWSLVANINFVQTDDLSKANVRFGTNRQRGVSAAYAYFPASTGSAVLFANDDSGNAAPAPGNYGFQTFIHEIGHALGLKHPGNYNAGGGGSPGPYLPSDQDNYAFSVMSYNDNPGLSTSPVTPSMFDIAAIQYLYGANMAAGPGDTTYTLSTAFQTVWDPNGNNTLSAAGQTGAAVIDMRETGFSTIDGKLSAGVAIGSRISNAIGGAGNDTFAQNGLNNRIDGGGGSDTVIYGGPSGQYRVTAVAANAYLVTGPEGTDLLVNDETIAFGDGVSAPISSRSSGSFDSLQYMAANPDLYVAFGGNGQAATDHFVSSGFQEGRSTSFDALRYAASNRDLALALGTNTGAATLHWLQSGMREGRSTTSFDALRYLASNTDLAGAFGANATAAELHYIQNGIREGRAVNSFDPAAYLAANADLASVFGSNLTAAEQHYIQFGMREGRRTAPVKVTPRVGAAAAADVGAGIQAAEVEVATSFALPTFDDLFGGSSPRDESLTLAAGATSRTDLAAVASPSLAGLVPSRQDPGALTIGVSLVG